MGQTAENLALSKDVSREDMDHFGVRSQNLAEQAIANGFWAARDHAGDAARRHRGRRRTTARAPGSPTRRVSGLKPVFRPDGRVTAGNCCPLNDGAAAVVIMSDAKAAELGLTPLARIVATGVSGLSPEIMGLGPVEASTPRAGATRA